MNIFEKASRAIRMLGESNSPEPGMKSRPSTDKPPHKPGLNGKQAALVFTIVMIVLTLYGELQRRANVVQEAGPAHHKTEMKR